MARKKVKTTRIKSKVYKKQSDLTKDAVKGAIKRSKRRALTAEEARRKVALHSAIHNPRMAFNSSQMPSDTVVHKKPTASEIQDE